MGKKQQGHEQCYGENDTKGWLDTSTSDSHVIEAATEWNGLGQNVK